MKKNKNLFFLNCNLPLKKLDETISKSPQLLHATQVGVEARGANTAPSSNVHIPVDYDNAIKDDGTIFRWKNKHDIFNRLLLMN